MSAVTGATGTAKVVTTTSEKISSAISKKLDDVAAAKAAEQAVVDAKVNNNFYSDGTPVEYGSSRVVTNHNEAIFWSGKTDGMGGIETAKVIAEKYKGSTLEQLIERRQIEMPVFNRDNPASVEAWTNISRELAKNSSGEVRISLGASVRPNSIWNTVKLPTLKQNAAVIKIIAVDPKTGAETIILDRNKK